MNIIFASQFYWPNTGGVQKVMHELASRLVKRGHNVTVATSKCDNRSEYTYEGVRIVEFDICGNMVQGMGPDVDAYRQFLLQEPHDVFMVKAAQQWSFDAALAVLPQMKSRKIHIPCGYSGLFDKRYAEYFKKMPDYLGLFDELIYYSGNYYDIDFAREHGLKNLHILCNGASENEFSLLENNFRQQYAIEQDDLLLLTVGSPLDSKGHGDCLEAFSRAQLHRPATLVMIGSYDNKDFSLSFYQRLRQRFKKNRFKLQMYNGLAAIEAAPDKKLLLLNIPREETLQAFKAADLFLFASHVEYSPLVLFEAAAAQTPFLSVDVGNSEEIANWTGCGIISPAASRQGPWRTPDVADFTEKLELLCANPAQLHKLGKTGRENWQKNFTWDVVTSRYENIFKGGETC